MGVATPGDAQTAVLLAPGQLDFGSVYLGDTASLQIAVMNQGAVPVAFGASILGGFSYETDCPGQTAIGFGTLAPGAGCSYRVNFAPAVFGAQTGALAVDVSELGLDAAGRPTLLPVQRFDVGLHGEGLGLTIAIAPESLSFGYALDGQASAPQTLRVTNESSLDLGVSTPALTGDFVQAASSTSCGAGGSGLLRAGQTCTVSVAFLAEASGLRNGALTLTFYGALSRQVLGRRSIPLSGIGHPLAVPAAVDFGDQRIGTVVAVPVAVSNHGPVPVTVAAVSVSGLDFSKANDCIGSLAPGATCFVTVEYAPRRVAPSRGALAIVSDDGTSPQTLRLAGTGSASKLAVWPANARGLSRSRLRFAAIRNGELGHKTTQWSSSDPSVATIDSAGLATLLAVGTTAITASVGDQRGSTVLTVTTAAAPVFRVQPANVRVGAAINAGSGVSVQLLDLLGDPLPGQEVAIAIGEDGARNAAPPARGTLSGTSTTTTNAQGIATFRDLKIDWYGTGYTLLATASPSSGAVSAASSPFDEIRTGDACLGPSQAACVSGCPDSDGDGLNDAWEVAGGIDVNGDGVIDAQHDVPLPGADPFKPDVYVRYDWMDYGPLGVGCNTTFDCTNHGSAHAGDTCTGPPVPQYGMANSCVQACTADADCTSISPSHVGDRCVANACLHTHDPEILAPGSLQAVVASFAAHGTNLHVFRGQAVPHSHVVSFRPLDQLADWCEGGSLASGTAGRGKYAESLYDLRPPGLDPLRNPAYHYSLFGHLSSCDTLEHCDSLITTGTCPSIRGSRPQYGQSGQAEIVGNDFIVSLGAFVSELGGKLDAVFQGATFMHELGHNLDLVHGGGVTDADGACQGPGCEYGPNYKPNYLSVMNYNYQTTGILSGAAPGSNQFAACDEDAECGVGGVCLRRAGVKVCARLDYSSQVLPNGGDTPGALWENGQLDEPAGLGSGTADLMFFTDGTCSSQIGASEGPVDWDGDGFATNRHAAADLNPEDGHLDPVSYCGVRGDVLRGHADWGPRAPSALRYGFQCNPGSFADGIADSLGAGAAPDPVFATQELTPELAARAHVLHPPRRVRVVAQPDCKVKEIAPGHPGRFVAAILGEKELDVGEIDVSSLGLHGARSTRTELRDVDGDGIPDLVVEFEAGHVKLHPNAKAVRLNGWLKNSQLLYGEDQVSVTQTPTLTGCRP